MNKNRMKTHCCAVPADPAVQASCVLSPLLTCGIDSPFTGIALLFILFTAPNSPLGCTFAAPSIFRGKLENLSVSPLFQGKHLTSSTHGWLRENWCWWFKEQTWTQFGSDKYKVLQTCAVTVSKFYQNFAKWGEGERETRTQKLNHYPKWDSSVGKLLENDIKGWLFPYWIGKAQHTLDSPKKQMLCNTKASNS